MASIQGIYIALFGRPADPLGLDYFNSVSQNGANLSNIRGLTGTAEYLDRFDGLNNAQIVTSIYQELFGRNPDAAGLAYFVAQLQSGAQTVETIAINILDGAGAGDRELVAAKEAAANLFTAAVRADPDALARYQGESGIAFGQSFIGQIDSADDTLTQAQVTTQVTAFGDGEQVPGVPGAPGSTFTLTAAGGANGGVDNITGTGNDDTFRAVDAGSLSTSDTLAGGAGYDTLNISDDAIAGAPATAAPVITGIERINNSDTGATLNLSAVSGVEQVWSNSVAAGGGVFTYTNATIGTVFGTSGSSTAGAPANSTVNIDYTGALAGRTTALLASSSTNAAQTTFDFGADAVNIEAVSINGVSGSSTVVIDADVTVLDTITVTGAGRVVVGSAETTITTLDASANTGGVEFTSGAIAQAAAITGGAGNDVFNLAAAGNFAMTVNAGAGNDLVTGGAGRDVINGGEGNDVIRGGGNGDTLTGGAGDDVFAFGASADSQLTGPTFAVQTTVDVIADFNVGNDTLSFVGFDIDSATPATQALTGLVTAETQIAVTNAVNGLASTATLADAVAAADGLVGTGLVATFQFQGNTYVFADTADTGDFLVQLTGNVALNATDFQFGA